MNLKALKKHEVEDVKVSKMFENINEFLNQLMPSSFLIGSTLQATILTTNTKIAHGLGATPQGFVIQDITADARVWRVSWDDKFITLKASAAVPVKLLVF